MRNREWGEGVSVYGVGRWNRQGCTGGERPTVSTIPKMWHSLLFPCSKSNNFFDSIKIHLKNFMRGNCLLASFAKLVYGGSVLLIAQVY